MTAVKIRRQSADVKARRKRKRPFPLRYRLGMLKRAPLIRELEEWAEQHGGPLHPHRYLIAWAWHVDEDRCDPLTSLIDYSAVISRYGKAISVDEAKAVLAESRIITPQLKSHALAKWLGIPKHLRSKYRLVRRYAGSYGQIVLACVLAMSAVEHPIMTLRDTEAGARIVSYLPMNIWTFTGNLSLDIHAEDDQLITVEGYSLIPGQMFDWFRGRREMNRVVQEVQNYLAAMGAVGT